MKAALQRRTLKHPGGPAADIHFERGAANGGPPNTPPTNGVASSVTEEVRERFTVPQVIVVIVIQK